MAHVTIAASESAFATSFAIMRNSIAWEKQDTAEFVGFRAGYHVKGHLQGGSVDLRDDDTVQIKELDIRWDRLELTLGVDLPGFCVGGGCIDLPWPLPDVCIPRVCLFEDNPDIEIKRDFSHLVAQELSFTGGMEARYFDAEAPASTGFDPCGALRDVLIDNTLLEPFPDSNQWHLFLNPQTVDIDLFDFPDIAGDMLEEALIAAARALIPRGSLSTVIRVDETWLSDLVRTVLDIPDEIDEWLSDLFNVSFGLYDFLVSLVLELFGQCVPIFRIDDPAELMKKEVSTSIRLSEEPVELDAVKLPIANLKVRVDDAEMVVEADLGV